MRTHRRHRDRPRARNQLDQLAPGAVSRLDYRARITAGERSRFLIQPQAVGLLCRTVAAVTPALKERGDVALEIDLGFWRLTRGLSEQ